MVSQFVLGEERQKEEKTEMELYIAASFTGEWGSSPHFLSSLFPPLPKFTVPIKL
jgi:hypothetical protein